MVDPRCPVLVGVARRTQRAASVDEALDPIGLMAAAAAAALADCAATFSGEGGLAGCIDAVATVYMLLEPRVPSAHRPLYPNPAQSVSRLIGTTSASRYFETTSGGQSPQLAVNDLADKIARGEIDSAVLVGAEALHTWERAKKEGYTLDPSGKQLLWGDAAGDLPEKLGYAMEYPLVDIPGLKHGMCTPTTIYAIFEQAIRAQSGQSDAAHTAHIAQLMAGFSAVAASSPTHAWFPTARSPNELATVTRANRAITRPGYPKYLNAIMNVDQSAAVVLCSAGWAIEHGIPENKWVFLHGCGDAYDLPPPRRAELDRSPGMREAFGRAMGMAQRSGIIRSVADVNHFDIYSCFPSAVQIALREMRIPIVDGSRLTVTGGLPFHGGPGNNYSMHAIAAMVDQLRSHPGDVGMVTANGGFLTEHSVGIYSTTPVEGPWCREHPQSYIPALIRREMGRSYELASLPSGTGVIDSYTVEHSAEKAHRAVFIGRLIDGPDAGRRFYAISTDHAVIQHVLKIDYMIHRCQGRVDTTFSGRWPMSTFTPDAVRSACPRL